MQTQSVILSSFFWGYIILQIPAGELAGKFGGSILVTAVIVGNSAVSLLVPLAAYYGGWQALCACRVLQEEKSSLGTLVYGGAQLGTALQLLVSGYIADYWGWPAIFYVNGALGAIWTAVYVTFGADSPQSSRMISAEEKLYIQTSLKQVGVQKKPQTPWRAICTSLPFIALIITHCGQNWGFWTLMTEMPSYMKQILGVDIKSNGLWGPAVSLVGLSYVPAGNIKLAVALLTLVVGLNAGHYTGFMIVHIDMAPNFAGTLMGITNFFANIISIVSPLIAGLILEDETDPSQWRQVFYLSSAVYIGANLFFVIFGSCELQPWNTPKENPEKETQKRIEKVV
ncbi:unnamed protein product [Arctia plantaginis]|uniref:Inorganic phosphate cotransporter n=1 Tax=Arctia plantaginis TaxID=874455 RepID=A0A8S1BGL9_ARCPL|nr:unnamed protein product [Arctia plantaginis]